jgi:lipopolysaccharide transport system ATP-binding protein
MSSNLAIKVTDLSKCYQLYEKPHDRLMQSIVPRLQKLFGLPPRQYFRNFWALKNCSFEIEKGETVGVIGQNGSGKSTLLQLICGTLTPTNGVIEVQGRVAALLELGAGFHPEFTGRENVYMNGALLGLTKEEIDGRFDEIAAFADIGEYLDQPVKLYSSGMYVRLAFAVVAHVRADILIIDEALAVGDLKFQQQCMRRLSEFQSEGKTLILVSHDLAAIKGFCETAFCMQNGSIVDRGPSGHVVDRYALRATMVHEVADGQERSRSRERTEEELDSTSGGSSGLLKSMKTRCFGRSGNGRIRIESVELRDGSGRHLSAAQLGQEANLVVRVEAKTDCKKLTVAFYVKDRTRLEIIGTNSENEGKPVYEVAAGQAYAFEFRFQLRLKQGLYSIAVIAADGSQSSEFYDWIEDVVSFEMLPSGRAIYALYSPPVELRVTNESTAVSR